MPLLQPLSRYTAISLMGISTLDMKKEARMEDRICMGSTGMYAS